MLPIIDVLIILEGDYLIRRMQSKNDYNSDNNINWKRICMHFNMTF